MNELQACELDILKVFVELCEKLGLRYFAVGGTLLGTIRHQGFIPWDDDIDVGMPRPDYEKFLKIAQANLPNGYFLQTYETDPEYLNTFAKIRNSNTTFIESSAKHLKINHGVYIDIFPYDGAFSGFWYKLQNKFAFSVYGQPVSDQFILQKSTKKNAESRIFSFLSKVLCKDAFSALKKLNRFYGKYTYGKLPLVAPAALHRVPSDIMPLTFFENFTKAKFEDFEIAIPAAYDAFLKYRFGDYMKFPPLEQQIAHHFSEIIDLHQSYTSYMGEKMHD